MSTKKNPTYPKVSVVIPAYNEEKALPKCLESVMNQKGASTKNEEGKIYYEVIVVDNNSKDKTAEIAEKVGARVISEFCQGVVFAFEKGFRAVKSDIVLMTDADTIVSSSWIKRIYEEYKKNNKVVGVAGGFDYDRKGIYWYLLSRVMMANFWLLTTSSGYNMSYRKSALAKVGGINTGVNLGSDVDIFQRLKKVGKCKYIPSIKVITSGRRFEKPEFNYVVKSIITYYRLVIFKKAEFQDFKHIR